MEPEVTSNGPARVKNPQRVRQGKLGMRARWADHVPNVVKLTDLTIQQRRLVLALINVVSNEAAGPVMETIGTGQEARRDTGEPS